MSPTGESIYRLPERKRKRGEKWRVDPIRTAGCIKLKELCKWRARRKKWWLDIFEHLLKRTTGDPTGWCGFDPSKKGPWATTGSDRMSAEEIQQLQESFPYGKKGQWTTPVLKFIRSRQKKNKPAMAAAMFLVKKSQQDDGTIIARIVYSCKKSNKMFARPPRFKLPSVQSIFRCIGSFNKPAFTTIDFRHYFYQIPLPEDAQPLFSVSMKVDKQFLVWQHNVLPMGFTWSPYFAQGITMAALYQTRGEWAAKHSREDLQPQIPNECFEDIVEFVDTEGHTCAFAMGWYDNVLIVAKDHDCNMQIARELKQSLDAANIIVKGSTAEQEMMGARTDPEMTEETNQDGSEPKQNWKGWCFSENEVTYIGIDLRTSQEGVQWRHTSANGRRWLASAAEPNERETSARQIASLVGILLWDVRVSGALIGTLAEEIFLSQIGKALKTKKDWDAPVDLDWRITENLADKVKSIATDDAWKIRAPEPTETPALRSVKIASDSSSEAAAFVILHGREGRFESAETIAVRWDHEEEAESINWKETSIAIKAIREVLRREKEAGRDIPSLEIQLAEDNTTAIAALNSRFYGKCPALCGELLELHAELQGCKLTVRYIPSARQPADEPSRGLEVDCKKCEECWNWLDEGGPDARRKRQREE